MSNSYSENLQEVAEILDINLTADTDLLRSVSTLFCESRKKPACTILAIEKLGSLIAPLFADQPLSIEEIHLVQELYDFWSTQLLKDRLLQPYSWTPSITNPQYWSTFPLHCMRYRDTLNKRIPLINKAPRKHQLIFEHAHSNMTTGLISSFGQFDSSSYMGMFEIGKIYLKKFKKEAKRSSIQDRNELLDERIAMELHLHRLANVYFQEQEGRSIVFQADSLWHILLSLLPNISHKTPYAMAESIGILNEYLFLRNIVVVLSADGEESHRFNKLRHFARISIKAANLEAKLWQDLDEIERAFTCQSCATWLYVIFNLWWGKSFAWGDFLLTLQRASESGCLQFSTKNSFALYFYLKTSSIEGKAENPIKTILSQGTYSDVDNVMYALEKLASDPSSIPPSTPYRVLLRSLLLISPLSYDLVKWRIEDRQLRSAAEIMTCFNICRIDPISILKEEAKYDRNQIEEYRCSVERSFLEWIHNDIELPQDSDISSSVEEIISEFRKHSLDVTSTSDYEDGYHNNKKPILDYLHQYCFAELETTSSMHEYYRQFGIWFDELTIRARQLNIDLIFLGQQNTGLCAIQYKSNVGKWFACQLIDEAHTSLDLIGFLNQCWEENDYNLIIERANDWMRVLCESLDFSNNVAVVATPVLSAFPIVPSLMTNLREMGKPLLGIAQISTSRVFQSSKKEYEGKFNNTFRVFVDMDLSEEEADWSSIELKGKVVKPFSREALRKELGENHKILHVISHGYFDFKTPLFSSFRTSDGVMFTVELLLERIRTKCFILNNCSSASSSAIVAANCISMIHASVASGADTAIGNTFPIDDDKANEMANKLRSSLANKNASIASAFVSALPESVELQSDFEQLYSWTLLGTSLDSLFKPWRE